MALPSRLLGSRTATRLSTVSPNRYLIHRRYNDKEGIERKGRVD